MKKILLYTLFQLYVVQQAFCQLPPNSDKLKINNILNEFMHNIETKDSVKMYKLFHKGPVTWVGVYKRATFQELLKNDSTTKNYKLSDYKTWFRRVLIPPIKREDFYNVEIIEDGSVASVTFDYVFSRDNQKQNWGKEFWHLVNENGEWKIASVIFSIELESYKPKFDIAGEQNMEAANLTRKMAKELLNISKLPGLSIAIRKKNELIFAEGFGYADLEKKIPVTTNTQFRAASTSKIITVTGLAKMMEDNMINIDAQVQKYVPTYPKKEYPITLRQLAGNTSGMPHYLDNDKLENKFYSNTKDALTVFSQHPLLFKPQSKYSYSSAGFVLLSAAMEGASGIDFLNYIQDKVLNPLDMKHTEPDMGRYKSMPNLTKYYERQNNTYTQIKNPREVSSIWAAGGFVTTPTDLVNLTKAYSNGYLTKATVDKMFESQTLLSGEKTNVGIGWRIGSDMERRNIVEHAGVTEGTRTVISYFPDDDIAISVMTNTEWVSSIEETAHMLLLPFLTKERNKGSLSGNFNIDASILLKGNSTKVKGSLTIQNGSGKIALENGTIYPIFHINNNTYALISNQGIYHLTIEVMENNAIDGKATMYKTPMIDAPEKTKPFFSFGGAQL